ncbi:MAG: hypothetical protein DRO88_04995, partial [Promethearchaeia archaeon]
KNKKIYFRIFLSMLLVLSNFALFRSVQGWKNGSYANNPADFDCNTDYGSHDWIADAILDYLLEINANRWNWLDERREIYYVGTEAPDNSKVSFIADGQTLSGFGDTSLHHIYFYENGTVFENEDDSAIRAKLCADWAEVSINEEKWDSAAFYLGALTHYIADMSMYAHVTDNDVAPYYLNFDEHHSTIEGYVNTRTNEFDDCEEFFQLKINITQIIPQSAYNATVALAWDTFADPNPSKSFSRDSIWLHEQFFSGWALTLASRNSETNATKIAYYDRIEENLNNAISTGISVFLNIGQTIGGTLDQAADDNDTDSTNSDENSPTPKRFISFTSWELVFISFSITMFVITLNEKRKFL